ncbi:MAG: DHHA1 domain-containing protein, partial [Reinekea forsetii]|nr:DHHA1 domain-containing protein [Reinekea forsetii]
QQRGSLVTFDKLRFDFSHLESVSRPQLRAIEQLVNQQILANTAVLTELTDIDSARESGAMALFGEKYADEVRVLSMGENGFSKELCGGTHVERTGDLGLFRILSESGIAAGVRRIEAVVGPYALAQLYQQDDLVVELQQVYKCAPEQLSDKAQQAQAHVKELEKEIQRLAAKQAAAMAGDLETKAVDVGGVKVLAVQLKGIDTNALRTTMDQLKSSLGSAIIVIAAVNDDKVQLAAGVTKDLVGRVKAGDLVRELGSLMGAKGGGKPDMAMAGGGDVTKLQSALDRAEPWVREKLGA